MSEHVRLCDERNPGTESCPPSESQQTEETRGFAFQSNGWMSRPDQLSFEANLIRHKARRLARGPGFTQADIPDIQQVLFAKLTRAFKKFDSEKSTPEIFARMVICRQAKSLFRSQMAICRNPLRVASLSRPKRLPSGETVEWAQALTESEGRKHRFIEHTADRRQFEVKHDVSRLLELLPPNLKKLAFDLQSQNKAEIAKRRGTSRSKVARETAEIRRVAENLGLGQYS